MACNPNLLPRNSEISDMNVIPRTMLELTDLKVERRFAANKG